MTLNGIERRNAPYVAFFSPNSIVLQAYYVTVVGTVCKIMSPSYSLPLLAIPNSPCSAVRLSAIVELYLFSVFYRRDRQTDWLFSYYTVKMGNNASASVQLLSNRLKNDPKFLLNPLGNMNEQGWVESREMLSALFAIYDKALHNRKMLWFNLLGRLRRNRRRSYKALMCSFCLPAKKASSKVYQELVIGLEQKVH